MEGVVDARFSFSLWQKTVGEMLTTSTIAIAMGMVNNYTAFFLELFSSGFFTTDEKCEQKKRWANEK